MNTSIGFFVLFEKQIKFRDLALNTIILYSYERLTFQMIENVIGLGPEKKKKRIILVEVKW